LLLRIRRALPAAIAALLCAGLTIPAAHGQEGRAAPALDRAALSEIARDVLRYGATAAQSDPEPTSPGAAAASALPIASGARDPAPPTAHIGPVRESISVPIPPRPAARRKTAAQSPSDSYESNSWRQRPPETSRALGFSSGVLPPSSGLDPALAAHADGARAQGRAFVYGFLRLRSPLDEALQKTIAGRGVKLLGPHDGHEKARLPLAAVHQVAALPDVEWVGVSAREQKLSPELTALRAPREKAAAVGDETGLPIVINLFDGDQDGSFRRQLEAAGAAVGEYDPALRFYRAVATWPAIEAITALDFVLFVELIRPTSPGHDQSTPLVDADLIRPGLVSSPPRFGGASIPVGIMDTGFMVGNAAAVPHDDLAKFGCGLNFTTDATGVWNDELGHGTHVLGTIAGTGAANIRYRGVAPDVGSTVSIRAAKVFNVANTASLSWTERAIDFMALPSQCGAPAPRIINYSGGAAGVGLTGTDSTSRKLDDAVWTNRQTYVVCAGNEGPGGQTIRTPGVAKNALTVGSAFDHGYLSVGAITLGSSRGPTGGGRMKPNVAAPGAVITSARAGTTSEYKPDFGCSMATPHVTGLAATLMEHYSEFRTNPAMLRAHLMATAAVHGDVTAKTFDYGLGKVAGYLEHWAQFDGAGWATTWVGGTVNASSFTFQDITVLPGTRRLVVVLTWDEPAASAGASQALLYDLDLWVDHGADCSDPAGACGEWTSNSGIDNTEYVVVENPPPGTYRLKVSPFSAPTDFSLPFGLAAIAILGDPTPAMTGFLSAPSTVDVGSGFGVAATIENSSYVATGVQIEPTLIPLGVTLKGVATRRWDGVDMSFLGVTDALTLGNVYSGFPRSAFWSFTADTPGPKTFKIRAWSENAGEVTLTQTIQVKPPRADLVETALTTTPPRVVRAPGTSFSVTDTIQNIGAARADASTTRYYLSRDPVKSPDDVLLGGSHSAHGLDPGASHSATVSVSIPAATPLASYYLLACADDKNAVDESDEGNNCLATPDPIIRVERPDLAESALAMNPPAPVRAPGTAFSVTDTVENLGAAASGPSTTRYYLSLDRSKGPGDTLLTGSRAVPVIESVTSALSAMGSHSGTVTVTIPAATPLNTYYLLACADDLNAVVESNEGNNCLASPTAAVTVTRPDLVASAVSSPPATKARGTAFAVADTVQNAGAVASGASTTRYYLSLDAVKSAGDTLLTGSRAVPALGAGASHSGTATVTIPAATPLGTYLLLACADGANAVVETDETNNCKPSSAAITVTP
jgi:subtilase family serine protease